MHTHVYVYMGDVLYPPPVLVRSTPDAEQAAALPRSEEKTMHCISGIKYIIDIT